MRYFFLWAALFTTVIISCKSKSERDFEASQKVATDSANFTKIQWLDSIVSFGTINKGEKVVVKFRCKNIGNKPLILASVRPGCGCTVADYTKEPIAPGTEGLITASFDSNKTGSAGEVDKTIIVTTNTINSTTYLHFRGIIKGEGNNDKVAIPHEMPQKK